MTPPILKLQSHIPQLSLFVSTWYCVYLIFIPFVYKQEGDKLIISSLLVPFLLCTHTPSLSCLESSDSIIQRGEGCWGFFKVQVFWNMTPSKLVKVTDFSEDLTFCVFRVFTANNDDSDCVVSEDVGSKHF